MIYCMAYIVTYRPRQQSFAVHNETVKLYRKNQKAHHSYPPCNEEIISAKKSKAIVVIRLYPWCCRKWVT